MKPDIAEEKDFTEGYGIEEHKKLTDISFGKFRASQEIINTRVKRGTFMGTYVDRIDEEYFGDWQIRLPSFSISGKWELWLYTANTDKLQKYDMWDRKEFDTLDELIEFYKKLIK